jgi:GPH family glycoside/pentoside/hexuronide:cation symporter
VYAVKESAYTMFILLFYTQVLGLSGTVTGFIIGLSLIWDGLSDPLVGILSDRWVSRFGRRHPLMLASAIPAGLGFIGLFQPPPSIQQSDYQLAAWLLFWSLWVRTFITGFAIPHLALSAEMTRDYNERSRILGTRMGGLFLCAVLLPAVALTFIFQAQNGIDGRFDPDNYIAYGALSCAVVWVMASITLMGTRRFITPSYRTLDSGKDPGVGIRRIWSDLSRTMENATFRLIIGYQLAASISYGIVATLNMLAWTYYWEFSTQDTSIILAAPTILAVGLVSLTLGPLSRRFQKFHLLRFAVLGMILNMLWLFPLRAFGLLPDNGADVIFWLNFFFMLVFIYCFLLRAVCSTSIVADVCDENELDYGVRQEATFFSVSNFIEKVATVVGPIYSGIVLDFIGLKDGALPGEVPQSVLDKLILAMGLGGVPILLVALWFVLKITMDKARVEDIQAQLQARHTQ